MKKQLLLALSTIFMMNTITAEAPNILEKAANAIFKDPNSPSNNDPALIGLTIVAAASAIAGLYPTILGYKKLFLGNQNYTPEYQKLSPLRRLFSSLGTRIGGLLLAKIGCAIITAGIGTILFNKEIITSINKAMVEFKAKN